MKPLTRQKRKPPKKTRCDATIGTDPNSRQPRLLSCPNEATVELKGGPFLFETWLCESCAQALEAKQNTEGKVPPAKQ